jgi:hypothetical protein
LNPDPKWKLFVFSIPRGAKAFGDSVEQAFIRHQLCAKFYTVRNAALLILMGFHSRPPHTVLPRTTP